MIRAYSLLSLKSVDDDQRILEGIATTPTPDRMGDVIEPEGAEFKLPLPLLLQHRADNPIGQVVKAQVTDEGIKVRIKIAAAGIDDSIDTAWKKIKAGLFSGLSIGFRSLEETFDKTLNGFRFLRWEWLELSVVAVPANSEATITLIKSLDMEARAASGQSHSSVVTLKTSPGVSGTSQPKGHMKKPIREQIHDFENKRAANVARADEIMTKTSDEGRSLNEAETEEHATLMTEIKSIDQHIVRLKDHEVLMASTAKEVPAAAATDPVAAVATRKGSPIQVSSNAPKGIGVARMAIAMIQAKNNGHLAADLARKYWPDDPGVEMLIRSVVEAGDTTTSGWASQLVPSAAQASGEFLDLLRAATIIGRLPLRRVPFNIAVPIRTAGGTFQWVGEAVGKPVTSETFSSVTLRWAKAAGIIVITQELARFSNPSAEVIIRDSMVASLTRFLDTQFVSTTAEVSNVSPAGILNGIGSTGTTGTTAAAFRTDMNNMLNNFTANNVDPAGIVLLMSATQALALSLMVTDLGVPLFPNISVSGGSLLGFPTVVSEAVGTKIIALNAQDILLAQDNGVRIDVSDQATVEMDTVPALGDTSPVTTISTLKSMWQNNLVGIRAEQFITWKAGRTSAVEYITANAYVP